MSNAIRWLTALMTGLAAAGSATADPPPMMSDEAQIARMRAMARVMTIAPRQRTRDQGEVLRETGLSRNCVMNIGALPETRRSHLTVNTTTIVEASPVISCGR